MRPSIRQPNSRTDYHSSEYFLPCLVWYAANDLLRMNKLIEEISKRPIPEHQANYILEVTCTDQDDEDVEVPYVMLKLQ